MAENARYIHLEVLPKQMIDTMFLNSSKFSKLPLQTDSVFFVLPSSFEFQPFSIRYDSFYSFNHQLITSTDARRKLTTRDKTEVLGYSPVQTTQYLVDVYFLCIITSTLTNRSRNLQWTRLSVSFLQPRTIADLVKILAIHDLHGFSISLCGHLTHLNHNIYT